MGSNSFSRRKFLYKTATTAGLTALGANTISGNIHTEVLQENKLPREVWIATFSQMGLKATDSDEMIQVIINILKKAIVFQPDIVCLPELFATNFLENKLSLNKNVEIANTIINKFSAFANENNCYLICPVYTTDNGKIYNSAILLDRSGKRIGKYHKVHITGNEAVVGISPGPVDVPVFKTDFGIIGIQICFDMLWDDGWEILKNKGADIVFWPSAYAGGKTVNTKAWRNKYVVVSSTRKNTSKICDISGDVISQTGIWDANLICSPVNLEKAFLHTWPYVTKFDEIRKKYGRRIKITNYHEEEWSIIESLSPEIKIKDILLEFNIKTFEQHKNDSFIIQNNARNR